MNRLEPSPASEHLIQYGSDWMLQKPSRVSKFFRLSRDLGRQIFSLGKTQYDFCTNYRDIFAESKEALTSSVGETACGIIIAESYQFSREPFIDGDPNEPNVIADFRVGCSKALVRTDQLVGEPAPVGLASFQGKPYNGLRHFDGAIYAQMLSMATGLGELIAAEVEAWHAP